VLGTFGRTQAGTCKLALCRLYIVNLGSFFLLCNFITTSGQELDLEPLLEPYSRIYISNTVM